MMTTHQSLVESVSIKEQIVQQSVELWFLGYNWSDKYNANHYCKKTNENTAQSKL